MTERRGHEAIICGFCKQPPGWRALGGSGAWRPMFAETRQGGALVSIMYCNNCGAILGAATTVPKPA
jgi:hypothetical protein